MAQKSKPKRKTKQQLCKEALDSAKERAKKALEDAKKAQGSDPKKDDKKCAAQPAKDKKDEKKDDKKKDDKKANELDRDKLVDQLKQSEGKGPKDTADQKWAYDDHKQVAGFDRGYQTIGHGFNMDSGGDPGSGAGEDTFNARLKGEKYDDTNQPLDFQKVYDGEQSITEAQAMKLFTPGVDNAIKDSKTFISNYDDQPEIVKRALADMTFNMGIGTSPTLDKTGNVTKQGTGLKAFRHLKDALEKKDYDRAANEMLDSQYCKDVGQRAINLSNQVRALADKPKEAGQQAN